MDLDDRRTNIPDDVLGALKDRAFALRVGAPLDWAPNVLALRGVEELSRPYHFDVTVEAPWGVAPERSELLGQQAHLFLRTHTEPRVIHGIVSSVRVTGNGDEGGGSYRLRLVPRFSLLAHTRDSRVFQDRTVPEVVSQVLSEANIPCEWRRMATYPKKPFCIQYQESYLDFVARLLAEEGIWYAFEQRGGEEVMVLADHAVHYHSISGDVELAFTRAHGLDSGEHISAFAVGSAVRPGAVQIRRYDYHRPSATDMAQASLAKPAATSVRPATRGANTVRGINLGELSVYDHHADYEEDKVVPEKAARMLEQLRRNAESGRGSSNCSRLTPGAWFKLVDHTSDTFEAEWAITRVEHHGQPATPGGGRQRPEYDNAFRCVPRKVHSAPNRPKRHVQSGLETATVVGPADEDVYTDELGRVKVQFHWDMGGGLSEQSSAWLRVVQGWSGQHAGAQFIPRVGTEVVVGFLGGDPDRPVVMGSMYNATHSPPFKLPAQKTRSGIRTSSTGGVGHNELSFEDAAGREEVHIHAQRDLNEVVLHDRSTDVGADLNVVVAGNSTESVGGERVEVVRGGRASTVMGDASRHVVGAERAVVDGDRVELIHGTAELAAQRMTTRVAETDARFVHGDSRATITGDQADRVQGCVTLQVGRAEAQTSYAMHVEGLAEVHGRRGASLTSEEEITLTCGNSSIRLTPDQIELVAPLILLTAEGAGARLGKDGVRMRANREATLVADTVVLRGEQASLGLDRDARLGGAKVKLGKVDDAEKLSPDEQPAPTRIELVDQEGQPLAHRRYKLYLADGSTRAGILDRNGVAVIDLELPAEVVFDNVQDLHAR